MIRTCCGSLPASRSISSSWGLGPIMYGLLESGSEPVLSNFSPVGTALPIHQQQRCMAAHKLTLSSRAKPNFLPRCFETHPRVRFSVGENRMKLANATNTNRKFGKPRDPLCALTPNKGHRCSATATRVGCLGRTNRLVKTCEFTGRAFVSRQGAQQVPRLPPDFLSSLVVSVDLMRLSLKKAAYVAVDECCVVGNPEFARDDKGEGGASIGNWLVAERIVR
jgi:hypothetical protein